MPLCTLEIPSAQFARTLDGQIRAVQVCERALDRTLAGLAIPDPLDRDYRLLVNDKIPEARLSISFTAGSDEYHTGNIFNPSKEQIHNTGVAIQEDVRDSELQIAQTRMEVWRDTVFVEHDPNDLMVSFKRPRTLSWIKACKRMEESKLTLVPSPDILKSISVGRESEPVDRSAGFRRVGNEIMDNINVMLALPDKWHGESKVLYPKSAQTDLAVEIDLPIVNGEKLTKDEMTHLARLTRASLNRNPHTRAESGNVWIRQGQPEVEIVNHES